MSDPMRDSLDGAIDRVATNLVSVADDPDAAQRIVASLRARRGGGWWPMSSLPLQAAALACVVLVVAYMRSTSSDEGVRLEHEPPVTMAKSAPAETVPEVPTNVRPVDVKPRALPVRRVAPRQRAEAEPAFGLAAIEVPKQLTIETLTSTAPLDPLEPAALTPMLLNDLPLASDGQTPFSKE